MWRGPRRGTAHDERFQAGGRGIDCAERAGTGATGRWVEEVAMNGAQASGVDLSNVGSGWVVYSADDRKVGEVREVRDTYLVVRQGMILGQWLYPPLPAVSRAERGSVHLTVAEDELAAQGWDEQPEAPV